MISRRRGIPHTITIKKRNLKYDALGVHEFNCAISWTTEVSSGTPQFKLKTEMGILFHVASNNILKIFCSTFLDLYCHQWFFNCFSFWWVERLTTSVGFDLWKTSAVFMSWCAFQNAIVHMKVTLQLLYLKGISLGLDLSKCHHDLMPHRQLSWWCFLFCYICEW